MTLIIYILVSYLICAGVELYRLVHQYAAARAIADEVADENVRLHNFNMDLLKAKLTAQRKLTMAQMTLTDLVNQNHGDRHYDIWARQRAADTLKLIERNP